MNDSPLCLPLCVIVEDPPPGGICDSALATWEGATPNVGERVTIRKTGPQCGEPGTIVAEVVRREWTQTATYLRSAYFGWSVRTECVCWVRVLERIAEVVP
jgi:hypothetical protein